MLAQQDSKWYFPGTRHTQSRIKWSQRRTSGEPCHHYWLSTIATWFGVRKMSSHVLFSITVNSCKVSQLIKDICDQLNKLKIFTDLYDKIGNWGSYLRDMIIIWGLILVLCSSFWMCWCMYHLLPIVTPWSYTPSTWTDSWIDSNCHTAHCPISAGSSQSSHSPIP